MNLMMLALIGLVVLFLLMFLRLPISFSMFIVGFIGVFLASSYKSASTLLSSDLWNQFSNYSFSVIPLYILMGEIIFRSGVTSKLFDAAYNWIGHLKGGMAATTILASAGFSSISGSNSATAATMATIALPELDRYKYNKLLSAGSVATGGTLGIIIPPSTVLIVISLQIGESVRDLFIASIVPGLLLTILLIGTTLLLCNINTDYGPAGEKVNYKEKFLSLIGVIPTIALFVFVIGGLYLGWFTPTESGAFGAFGAIVLSLLMRKMTWEKFVQAVAGAIRSSAMVLMLVVGAMLFGRFLTLTRLPHEIALWVNELAIPATITMVLILLIYVIGGSLMDALGFLIISIPIFYPTVILLGYDPVWFAVVLTVVTSMGAITPPVGVNVFIVQGLATGTSLIDAFKGASYYLVPYVVFIALLMIFPSIILFLI